MRPVFADPKTDFVFKRIFGSEVHKPLLIELLNDLLELSGDHRIIDIRYLSSDLYEKAAVAASVAEVIDETS